MGIELRSENLSLGFGRRYHRSKSQLVPKGAKRISKQKRTACSHRAVISTRSSVQNYQCQLDSLLSQ